MQSAPKADKKYTFRPVLHIFKTASSFNRSESVRVLDHYEVWSHARHAVPRSLLEQRHSLLGHGRGVTSTSEHRIGVESQVCLDFRLQNAKATLVGVAHWRMQAKAQYHIVLKRRNTNHRLVVGRSIVEYDHHLLSVVVLLVSDGLLCGVV